MPHQFFILNSPAKILTSLTRYRLFLEREQGHDSM